MKMFSVTRLGAIVWLALALLLALDVQAAPIGSSKVAEQRQELSASYRQALDRLAEWCDEQRLKPEAKRVRRWALPSDPLKIVIPLIPATREALPADATAAQRDSFARFSALRQQQASELFKLAQAAAAERQATTAYELVHLALREDPDHAAARRILGYVREGDAWLTPYEVDKAAGKQVWDDRFGWLLRDRLPRYERGERFNRGRWVSAEEDARLSRDIASGWNVVTEHFAIRTNSSLAEGARVARRLEELYRGWRQLFVLYYASEADVARWLAGGPVKLGPPRRADVSLYRTRDEYNAALVKDEPNISRSTGYYRAEARRSFFYSAAPDEPTDDTAMIHEATHQLFSEWRHSRATVGEGANFWIVEGVACYLESLTEHDGYLTVGGRDSQRLVDAEHRLRGNQFYVPLAELTAMGREPFQRHANLPQLYSQSAGLTHFLMHSGGGRYRDALVDYMIAIYTGRDTTITLREATGVGYEELDRQYRAFIEALPR
ncbi:MAG: hypothetical protein JSS27_04270 [Planctomycetes bacterium]|nr:hypothetical protein [Planctomycetota bacterium]